VTARKNAADNISIEDSRVNCDQIWLKILANVNSGLLLAGIRVRPMRGNPGIRDDKQIVVHEGRRLVAEARHS
jgi:hypothetical protein